MADTYHTPETPSATDGSGLQRRDRSRRKPARTATTKTVRPAVAAPPKRRRPKSGRKPARTLVILTMVGGLIATVALPAYAAVESATADPMTLQQVAVDDAQSLVVASDAGATELSRSSYSATTAEEIEKKKAEEAAAERARIAAELAAAAPTSSSSGGSRANVDLSMVAPGTGEVRWPLSGFTVGDRTFSRGGAHMGTDMLAPCGEPLFAAAAGVVRVSQESYGGYGVAVTIDHVINGQRVSTLYGHMTYGSRAVQAGQTVSAGQIIGLVGSTGRSTACHLHFETYINGSVVDSYEWLLANAG
ncbi:M23 family metallopeptidase [Microbacterium sp. ET2]|uniref:M23 family metallopeptidase n=1 Tax=Microbacterium albipurpureum TaxID=3050384 RepID=UPI00259CC555|nr:M23 family metallopeptidase [Microbacterium sp. ET2 (Ac-2212)]WJL96147.1 M23 family metallopeptidase [Microbacterium sp. ET2 (Ac-2212)]